MTKIWAGPAVGWAYLVCVIDCCTREIVDGIFLIAAEETHWQRSSTRYARLPEGSREACVTLTTDNGTQFTSSRFYSNRSTGWESRIDARRIITRKATATSNDSIAA